VVGGTGGDQPAAGSPSGGPSGAAPTPDDPVEDIDLDSLVDAPTETRSGVDRVTDAFPGAQVVDP
jgi:hypothetical protein